MFYFSIESLERGWPYFCEELKLFIYSKTDELNITKSDCRQKIDFAKKIKVSNKLNPEIEPLFLADQCLMIFTRYLTP